MLRYVIKRLIEMIPLMVIISMIAFGIIRIAEVYAKANPISALRMNPTVTQATINERNKNVGFDQPLPIRYFNWAKKFIVGDMGESYYYKTSVNSLIKERLNNTLIMGLASMFVTWLIAIPLGISLAVRQYSWSIKSYLLYRIFFKAFQIFSWRYYSFY